jgi:hypothetical protein
LTVTFGSASIANEFSSSVWSATQALLKPSEQDKNKASLDARIARAATRVGISVETNDVDDGTGADGNGEIVLIASPKLGTTMKSGGDGAPLTSNAADTTAAALQELFNNPAFHQHLAKRETGGTTSKLKNKFKQLVDGVRRQQQRSQIDAEYYDVDNNNGDDDDDDDDDGEQSDDSCEDSGDAQPFVGEATKAALAQLMSTAEFKMHVAGATKKKTSTVARVKTTLKQVTGRKVVDALAVHNEFVEQLETRQDTMLDDNDDDDDVDDDKQPSLIKRKTRKRKAQQPPPPTTLAPLPPTPTAAPKFR